MNSNEFKAENIFNTENKLLDMFHDTISKALNNLNTLINFVESFFIETGSEKKIEIHFQD